MATSMNPYIRKTLYLISFLVLVALFVVLGNEQADQICERIEISIDAPIEKQLISQSIVQDKLDKWYSEGLSGVAKKDISLLDIEQRLEELPAVKNAEVSFDLRGELKIYIDQRIPLVRIVSEGGVAYYLAKDFYKIPVLGTEAARVPIANGRLSATMIKKVYTLSTYVQENDFMEALTEQIFVNKNSDLVIVPKLKKQKIIIGDTTDLHDKFHRLLVFYRDGLNHVGWEKYRTINLIYKYQIVCN